MGKRDPARVVWVRQKDEFCSVREGPAELFRVDAVAVLEPSFEPRNVRPEQPGYGQEGFLGRSFDQDVVPRPKEGGTDREDPLGRSDDRADVIDAGPVVRGDGF